MAIAKKCDRCGKYYDINTTHVPPINLKECYEDGIWLGTTNVKCSDVKDLCDECLDKLHMFLNGAELILEDSKND